MSDIEKASREAVEAARQGEQFALVLAAVKAAQQAQPAPCQHQQAPGRPFEARRVVTYTVCGCAVAAVASLFFMAFAIGAISVALSALVLWRVWTTVRPKG